MKWKREIFGGQHEPLISKKLFDTCQEVMGKRGRVHEVHKNNFAFLGLLKCASCGASITAEKQKGHHYYRCTKKKGLCQEKHYLREEILTEQITFYLQKVSLSRQDTEKVLAALDSEQDKAREDAQAEVGVLKEQLSSVETKLVKLLDVYLADALSTEKYAAKKQSLLSQKVLLSKKITDFETKGLSWLEPAREFVKSLNQAANLLSSPNPTAMTTFLKNIGSNHILRNREFVFTPKIEYELVAERSEANLSNLQFPTWCLYCTKLAPTFKTKANCTRGARGGSELNRTLDESPATASLHSAIPKRKNVPCSFDFRGGGFFLKKERTFFFLGFCLPSIQAVGRGFNSDSVLRKLFSGDMDFRKTETNLFLDFVRAEEGSGEESARASEFLNETG